MGSRSEAGDPVLAEALAREMFAGGGEMGARMRAFDWSSTPMGPVAAWPRGLTTVVRIMLDSHYPMAVWWGAARINLYNDAYAPVLGKRHPWALGQRAQEIWNEVWDFLGPHSAVILAGQRASPLDKTLLILERNGYAEETYFTMSPSPIPADDGGIGGILCVCTEHTPEVLGQRRLSTLRALGERTADEAVSAEAACELAAATLAGNPHDLPFALVYLLEGEGTRARLAAATGLPAGEAQRPSVIALDDDGAPWPLGAIARAGEPREVGLPEARGPWPGGPWPEPARRAFVVPLGGPGPGRPTGFLVAGLSARRAFDDDYRGFLALTAGHIALAIANARAHAAERERVRAMANLDRAKTTFFSNVSHELRTPLTLMLGPLEEGLADPSAPALRERLEVVHRNALRLQKLVGGLLDFARIEAGRMQAAYQPTDLAALTRQLASVFRSAIERAGLRLGIECPSMADPVYVDRDMWEKIVLNLLSNAFKFTFEGTIRVALHAVGAQAQLEVEDTGVGIAAPDLPRLFQRFERFERTRARTHEGTGIGLALVRDLVKLHGGEVSVSSRLGAGTKFVVSLPLGTAHLPADRLVAGPAEAAPTALAVAHGAEALEWLPERHAADAPALAAGGATVLVADDNADMRAYIGRLLSPHWTVETVADGAEALAAARARRPDLILADVMMPNLDGFALLEALRADARTRTIPVIMLTARAGEDARLEGLKAGADDYLVKPFSARELLVRVSTHLQIARLRAASELEREKLHALFEQAPIPIVVYEGPEHRVVVFNAKAHEGLRGARKPLPGERIVDALPELEGSTGLRLLDETFRTGEARTVVEQPISLRGGDGAVEDRCFTVCCHPVRDVDGKVTGVMTVAFEVTEEVRLRRAALEANRAKDEFLAMLGHELRNPLMPILTALELMKVSPRATQRGREVIERQVHHLIGLVDDLMDVARITRGKVRLAKRPVELGEVVAAAVETASPLLESRAHHLHLDVPARGLRLSADPQRLAQVLSNLLTNAAKYTDPGGRIAISAARDDGRITISVKDNGVGLSASALTSIFEPFVQARQRPDRNQGGLGLGLALVRSLVTLHRGTVTARSAGRGKGSEFVVSLPALPVRERVRRPPASERPAAPAGEEHRRRVLLVDDNSDITEMLALLLRQEHWEVATACDGPEALRVAQRFVPDVAIVDIGLPVMDGYEVARRLRKLAFGKRVRLIALTGYGQRADRELSKKAGFSVHLIKPVDLGALSGALVA